MIMASPNLFSGCFKYNFPLVTIYTNLGESGVQYGISQTKAEHVLVSQVWIKQRIRTEREGTVQLTSSVMR